MTTIKIPDGRPADHEHEVTVETLADFAAGEPRARDCPGPSSPIMLSVHEDYEAAGVWLSPAKAREVIAALQAAVDEVEPPGPPRLVRGNRPDRSRDREIAERLKAKGGIVFEVWFILGDFAFGLDEIADRFVESERPSTDALMDALSQLEIMGLVERHAHVPWTWQRPRAVVRQGAVLPPRER